MKKNQKKRKRSRAGRSARRGGRAAPTGREGDEIVREKILRGRANEAVVPETASQGELEGSVRDGRVVAIRGTEILVEPFPLRADPSDREPGGVPPNAVSAILRKSTRVAHPDANAVVVADRVRYLEEGEPPYVLTEILPRRSRLSRERQGREHVLVSNVDLGVIVASALEPPFKPRLVDRFLVSFVQGGVEPALILNKVDLLEADEVRSLLAPYRHLPFPALAVSAESGAGLEALREILRDRTAVFSGQSGVGKSTLLNRLAPGLGIVTGEVYGRLGKGRHTTTASTLYRFPFGGAVVDTPGIRSFSLHKPTPEVLEQFFPEIFREGSKCRYSNCAHRGELGCALPEAVRGRRVLAGRLESFHVLMDEIASG